MFLSLDDKKMREIRSELVSQASGHGDFDSRLNYPRPNFIGAAFATGFLRILPSAYFSPDGIF